MCSKAERIDRGDDVRSGLVARFVAEDGAQDLVEYALLAAFIGLAGWAIVTTLPDVMRTTYESWMDPGVEGDPTTGGVPARWDPPEPAGS
jgi:Flp pilus assembly pilin Flp